MPTRKFVLLLTLAAALLLTACGKEVELRQKLSEEDSNEILAALAQYGIAAGKQESKEGLTVTVPGEDFNRAVTILREAGLPRRRQASLGEVFRKEGMVSTPIEERARYIYALSQELERTLLEIDGVLSARVHVVLPERVSPGDPINPSSAAVFIKYRPNFAAAVAGPRITQLVAHSIPGLSDANRDNAKVSVILMPAQNAQPSTTALNEASERKKRSSNRVVATIIGGLVTVLLAALGFILWRLHGRHQMAAAAGDAPTENDQLAASTEADTRLAAGQP